MSRVRNIRLRYAPAYWFIVILLSATIGCFAFAAPPKKPLPTAHPPAGSVHLYVQNGLFHVMDDVMLTVPRLEGWMIPQSGQIVSLDSKKSFILQINSGETYLKAEDLSALLNDYLLPRAKAPIKKITVTFVGDRVAIKGDLHKILDIPFEGEGTVSVADDTDIRVHFTQLKVAGMVKKGVLDAMGIKLSSVAQPRKPSRFYIEGDDIILPINALFPPPRIAGKLTGVSIQGNNLVQVFGAPATKIPEPPTAAKNFLYFQGGRMKFGKITMDDVDLELVDKDPANGFDFSLDHYAEQLQGGYSKSLPGGGLVAFVPDYSTVAKPAHAAK